MSGQQRISKSHITKLTDLLMNLTRSAQYTGNIRERKGYMTRNELYSPIKNSTFLDSDE